MSKISVVIPLYNKEYSVVNCISSVLLQSVTPKEIIIIDDGSTDNSLVLIKESYRTEIRDGLIKIVSQPNQGVSIARNNGTKLSKTKYICFLDADDEWKFKFLEEIECLIDAFPHAALYCLQHEMKRDGKIIRNKSLYKENYLGLVDNFFKKSLFGSLANSSKVCIKKDVLDRLGGFPEGQKSGEDLFVWMQIALKYPVAFHNRVLSIVNVFPDDSRNKRNISVPYPFIYYSHKKNRKELNFWSKIYLYKILIIHILSSIKDIDYHGFKIRVDSGKSIFPISMFFFSFLIIPIKVISREK